LDAGYANRRQRAATFVDGFPVYGLPHNPSTSLSIAMVPSRGEEMGRDVREILGIGGMHLCRSVVAAMVIGMSSATIRGERSIFDWMPHELEIFVAWVFLVIVQWLTVRAMKGHLAFYGYSLLWFWPLVFLWVGYDIPLVSSRHAYNAELVIYIASQAVFLFNQRRAEERRRQPQGEPQPSQHDGG
jgi:hypothetical protein